MKESKKVFISYSWVVQPKVIELSERLMANGVDVILDVYDLKEGHDKYAFMEQSVNDPSVDKVLIICDESYTKKADNRSGGVGDETVIITPEIYGQSKQEKFIPIIFEVDENGKAHCPIYLKSRIYFNLSTEEDQYEVEYEKLLRNIYDKPLFKKLGLGTKPEWLETDTVDLSTIRDLIKQIRGHIKSDKSKADFLLRKTNASFIDTAKQYKLPCNQPRDEGLLIVINQLKVYRDLVVDFCEALIYSSMPVAEIMANLLEGLYNELHDANGMESYNTLDFELYNYMCWELFICIIATLIFYERYEDIFKMATHTYFIKESYFGTSVKSESYFKFYTYMDTIEKVCKPKCENPNLFTLTGEILVKRERKPILTKESISNADIILYQLGTILNINRNTYSYWYPLSYIYHSGSQVIWQKLKSKQYCLKIAPIFGCQSIDELKEILKKPLANTCNGYQTSFDSIPNILSNLKYEDIASLN